VNAVVRFARIAASQLASSVSPTGENPWPPAFATSTSMRPKRASTSATAAFAEAVSAASAMTGTAPTARSTSCRGAALLPTTTTCAPSAA
jgi:hypothetical protein